MMIGKSHWTCLVLVGCMTGLVGCLSDAHRLEQARFREVLLSLTEEQIMDNLIRTYNHQPIVQMAYTNITGLIKDDIVGMFNGSQTDIAGAITNMFAYSATNTFGNSLSVTANPIIDGRSLVKTKSKITGGKEDATFKIRKSIYELYYDFVNGTAPDPKEDPRKDSKKNEDKNEFVSGTTHDPTEDPKKDEDKNEPNNSNNAAEIEPPDDSADAFDFQSRETILSNRLEMLKGPKRTTPPTPVQREDPFFVTPPAVDETPVVLSTQNSITIDVTRLNRTQLSWLPKLVVTKEEPLGPGKVSKEYVLARRHKNKEVFLKLSGNYIQKRKCKNIHTGEATYFWIPIEFGIDYFSLSLSTSVGLGDLARTNALSQPILSELTLQRLSR